MPYILKEKFNIFELLPQPAGAKSVAIIEPEWYLFKIYEMHLTRRGFEVIHGFKPEHVYALLQQKPSDILLLNVENSQYPKVSASAVSDIASRFPRLKIITHGFDTHGDDLKEYMAAGIGGHINRKMSKPQDIVHVIETLLQETI